MAKSPIEHQSVEAQAEKASFQALIRQVAEGSESAVWELCERYSKNILRAARRHLPNAIRSKVDSVDIVQSVWKSLLRKGLKLDEFETIEAFVAYLAAMAKNKAIEQHRHFTKIERSDVRIEVRISTHSESGKGQLVDELRQSRFSSPSAIAEANDQWKRAIANNGPHAEAIVQLKLGRKSLDEIAREVGTSKATIRRIIDSLVESLKNG